MHRRWLLGRLAALSLLPEAGSGWASPAGARRVRPGDAAWPTLNEWDGLRKQVGDNLVVSQFPLDACRAGPESDACETLFRELKNPYFIGDNPFLTQTCGWVDAWTAQPSAYIVAARSATDVAAAVSFAREHRLRLVVKGGGHSYLGSSNAPDSLMIWTRRMDAIAVHDSFVPQGCEGLIDPAPAVSAGAGAIWMHAYQVVTGGAGRYVQGGGCGTVGIAGLVQGGGFGSYSKAFGTAASSLLEAEIVTADGIVRVVNAQQEPELFWALKGGGGGTFGVVTRVTLRTWDLPSTFGSAILAVKAGSDVAWRELLLAFVHFYAGSLCNPHWGELVRAMPSRRLDVAMNFQGLTKPEAEAVWRPFLAWLAAQPELSITTPFLAIAGPARYRWDGAMLDKYVPGTIRHDDRPGAPNANFFWTANLAEAGHVIHDFQSVWLPESLLEAGRREALADALAAASRHWTVEMHFQKGLAGAPAAVAAATRDTPMNPDVVDAFMLVIVASEGPPAFPGLTGHEPDVAKARRDAARIAAAMRELRKVAPDTGAYLAESSYFQPNWQQAYWGENYPRLLAIKRCYDPEGLFFVRHGVGSEVWSEDGFMLAI